jgi:hypothetical protein
LRMSQSSRWEAHTVLTNSLSVRGKLWHIDRDLDTAKRSNQSLFACLCLKLICAFFLISFLTCKHHVWIHTQINPEGGYRITKLEQILLNGNHTS